MEDAEFTVSSRVNPTHYCVLLLTVRSLSCCCFFFFSPLFFLPGLRPVLSVLMSPLPTVAVSIWLWPWRIRFTLFPSLSLNFPPGSLTSLYFSLSPPPFNLFRFHPTLFCPSTPLAQPFLSLSELSPLSRRCCRRTASGAISGAVRRTGDFTSAAK